MSLIPAFPHSAVPWILPLLATLFLGLLGIRMTARTQGWKEITDTLAEFREKIKESDTDRSDLRAKYDQLERDCLARDKKHESKIVDLYGRIGRTIAQSAQDRTGFALAVADIMYAVSDGRLRWHVTKHGLPRKLRTSLPEIVLTEESLHEARSQVAAVCIARGFDQQRSQDLITAVGEAIANAVRHGNGGRMCIRSNAQMIQVWIVDCGHGIRAQDIPRAALQKGWSSVGSLGQGFVLMTRTVDTIDLVTDVSGTVIVLTMGKTPNDPRIDALLA